MRHGHDAVEVARYMLRLAADKDCSLTPMQVLKLVYIAHGWNLGLHGNPLVKEAVQAWQYGPVIPDVYHHYKHFGGAVITDIPEALPRGFSDSEASIMRQVFDGYGHRTGISLSSLTHEIGTPWSSTVKQSGIGAVISTDLIEEYYSQLARKVR